MHGNGSLPPDVKIAFYHIAQEALNNVAKHARAGNAAVTLKRRPDRAHLTVKDDGRGFVIDKVTPEHLGLTIMHERAEAIGRLKSRAASATAPPSPWPGGEADRRRRQPSDLFVSPATEYNESGIRAC